jgi:photosystem II stability/assembly factor-like uncharacterized protein
MIVLAGCGRSAPRTSVQTSLPRTSYSSPTTSRPAPARPPAVTTTTTTPIGFHADSVTFVSTQLGWVLGTDSCSATLPCANVLLRTEDAGRSWTRIPAPVPAGVYEVRFADANDGWVWGSYNGSGPGLWSTHDGGLQWTGQEFPQLMPGYQVSDVEAAGGVVRAAFNEGQVALEASPVGGDDWVLSPISLSAGAGPAPDEQIVLQGTAGWVVVTDRGVLGGARLDHGAWTPWTPPCDGDADLSLTASDRLHLVAVCDIGVHGASPPQVRIYSSTDEGSTFHMSPISLPPVGFGPVVSPTPGVVVVTEATGDVIASFDGFATWSTVYPVTTDAYWSYMGFTTPRQGVAINDGVLLMTFDGGHSWEPVLLPTA